MIAGSPMVGVRVGFTKVELRAQGEAGGREVESSPPKVRELHNYHVAALKLEAWIVEDKASNSRYQGRETKHLYVDVLGGLDIETLCI